MARSPCTGLVKPKYIVSSALTASSNCIKYWNVGREGKIPNHMVVSIASFVG